MAIWSLTVGSADITGQSTEAFSWPLPIRHHLAWAGPDYTYSP
jgi:hypothetical protein